MIKTIYYVDTTTKTDVIVMLNDLRQKNLELCEKCNIDPSKKYLCFKFNEDEDFIGFANYAKTPELYNAYECFNLAFKNNLNALHSLLAAEPKSDILTYTISLLSKCFPKYKFNDYEQDKNQLQGEEVSDSGRDEGNIFHYRRDKPQFATGRHCDEAGIKIQTKRTRGYQNILPSRCPEVLRCQ